MAPAIQPSPNSNNEDSKSRRPGDSNFKQQRLPAWTPILSAGTVLPTFFVIGVAFIPVGIGMVYLSSNVMEAEVEYTDCLNINNGSETCAQAIANNASSTCHCVLDLNIDQIHPWVPEENMVRSYFVKLDSISSLVPHFRLEASGFMSLTFVPISLWKPYSVFFIESDWPADVYLYYGLTNFYQNHRRYVKSRDDNQLLGYIDREPSSECDPFVKSGDRQYIPCGAIANSLFSDTIDLYYKDNNDKQLKKVDLLRTGIAWESDKKYKFKNPTLKGNQSLKDAFLSANYIRPKNWYKDLWELDPENPDNNGLQNEDLMVWMRTAALPNFRKLYRRVNHTAAPFDEKFPKFDYKLNITYRFEVKKFSGTKSIIISTTSILGGKNLFLGIAYIVVGGICLLLGIAFLFVHIKFGKPVSEMTSITTRTPYN